MLRIRLLLSTQDTERVRAWAQTQGLEAPSPGAVVAELSSYFEIGELPRLLKAAGQQARWWKGGIMGNVLGVARLKGFPGTPDRLALLLDTGEGLDIMLADLRQGLSNVDIYTPPAPSPIAIDLGPVDAGEPFTLPAALWPSGAMRFDALEVADSDLPALSFTFPLIEPEDGSAPEGSLGVIKEAGGAWRWYGVTGTALEDRDKEIISSVALAEAAEALSQSGDYGPLLWWHLGEVNIEAGEVVSGVTLGTCDYSLAVGPLLIESGLIEDPAIAQAMADNAELLAFSIGFVYDTAHKEDGCYNSIKLVERSILPRGKESNPFTSVALQPTTGGQTA